MRPWLQVSGLLLSIVMLSYTCAEAGDLAVDEALLTVDVCAANGQHGNITVNAQNTNCWNCSSIVILKLPVHGISNGSAILFANHSTVLNIVFTDANGLSTELCSQTLAVEEHAEYVLAVNINAIPSNTSCLWKAGKGTATNMPILYACAMLAGLCIAWNIVLCAYRRRWHEKLASSSCCKQNEMGSSDRLVSADLGIPSERPGASSLNPLKERFVALDVFRGLSLALMIFVNYGGGGYWFFSHSEWNGLTVADLLFPWFVFIMGMAVPLTQRGTASQRTRRREALCKIVTRTLILFALGLLVNSRRGNDVATIRIMGVLQRLSLSYLIVALVGLLSPRPNPNGHEGRWWAPVRDLVYSWPQLLVAVLLLLTHIAVSLFVPYDSTCPTGYLGPGGLHDGGIHRNCTGGIAKYIDLKVLGLSHIYLYPTCKSMYQCTAFDPEGLFGTLTSAALCCLGTQASCIYVCYKPARSRIVRWFFWAVITGGVTLLLTKASQDDGWIPINKNLWSASFVLAMASLAYMALIILHLVIDIFGAWNGSPFYYAGINSIAVYLGSEVLSGYVPISFRVSDDHLPQLFMNIWSVAFFLLAAFYMYRKRLFISV